MRRTKTKEYYEWQDYERDIRKLARKIKTARKRLDNIYGLPRNGLIPAVSLSHLLGKPIIFDVRKVSEGTLVVDDIVDTGRTFLRLLKTAKARPLLCALYYNPLAKIRPTIYIRLKKKWVVFPWETRQSSKYDFTI